MIDTIREQKGPYLSTVYSLLYGLLQLKTTRDTRLGTGASTEIVGVVLLWVLAFTVSVVSANHWMVGAEIRLGFVSIELSFNLYGRLP